MKLQISGDSMEEESNYQPIYMNQEQLYAMLRRIAKEQNEWCNNWVDQDILDLCRAHDKENKKDLQIRYIKQCHHPEIKVEMNEDDKVECEVICPDCIKNGRTYNFSKTAKLIEEKFSQAQENSLQECAE